MTTYCITSPYFCAGVVTTTDTVVQAAPVLRWTIGKSFVTIRDYCQKRGWTIEPVVSQYKPTWLEYEGRAYELHWDKEVLKRVTVFDDGEPKDLTYNEIPEVLKGLIYGNDD